MLTRVLVVDDEPIIVRCIEDLLICQDSLDLDIVTANSAGEALKWLEKLKIDIMLTDIEMPEMSGIQLISAAKQRWPMLKAIVLTAHSNFDYAYQAIQLGVEGYLLKTDQDERIVQQVCKAIEKLEEEMEQARQMEGSARLESAALKLMHRQLFLHLISGVHGEDETDIWNTLVGLGFARGEAPIFLIQALASPDGAEASAHLETLMQVFVADKMRTTVFQPRDGMMYWLIQPSHSTDKNRNEFVLWLKGTLEMVQASFSKKEGCQASFVMGMIMDTPSSLPEMCVKASRMLKEADRGSEFIYSLIDAENDVLCEMERGMVQIIKEYVCQHLTEDLSLHQFSEMTHYNPAYISRFFHEECGETLNHYISRMKLNAIKVRMEDAGLTLSDIAQQLGFESRPYFNRFVKRMSGLSPQALRDEVMSQTGKKSGR